MKNDNDYILESGAWNYNEGKLDESQYLDKPLINSIINFLNEEHILFDFGCGTGYYLKYINSLFPDKELIGIEPSVLKSSQKKFNNIIELDLSKPFNLNKKGNILCLEVLEHIPLKYESVAIDNIINHCNNYLFLSWAKRGQGGLGHINEKNENEVINIFSQRGFLFLGADSIKSRLQAEIGWIRNNFCIFKKMS